MDNASILAIVGIIAGILYPTLIGWNNYRKEKEEEKEKIRHFQHKFERTKKLNENIIDRLIVTARHNNCFEQEFIQGISYESCIGLLQNAENQLFNDDITKDFRQIKRITTSFEDASKHLDIHYKHLCEIKTVLDLYVDKIY